MLWKFRQYFKVLSKFRRSSVEISSKFRRSIAEDPLLLEEEDRLLLEERVLYQEEQDRLLLEGGLLRLLPVEDNHLLPEEDPLLHVHEEDDPPLPEAEDWLLDK